MSLRWYGWVFNTTAPIIHLSLEQWSGRIAPTPSLTHAWLKPGRKSFVFLPGAPRWGKRHQTESESQESFQDLESLSETPPPPQTEKVTFKSRWIHQHQRDVRRERQLKCRPCFYSSGLKALRANSLKWHLYFERCGSARENKTSSCQNQKRSGKFTPRFFFCWACFSLLKKAGLFFFFFYIL